MLPKTFPDSGLQVLTNNSNEDNDDVFLDMMKTNSLVILKKLFKIAGRNEILLFFPFFFF